jgi:hypothetical protein
MNIRSILTDPKVADIAKGLFYAGIELIVVVLASEAFQALLNERIDDKALYSVVIVVVIWLRGRLSTVHE